MGKDALVSQLRAYLQGQPEVRFAHLFGSQATGRANVLSDVDVAVLVDQGCLAAGPYGYRAALIAELSQVLGTQAVDLVVLNTASPTLRFQVIRYGQLLFARSDTERVEFQVRTFNEYQDARHLFREHQARLRERLATGRFGRG
ncbi:MAG: nucleotidyltransferase domain-containing protein [Deinococcus sp.]|nr:nucleotidyltransferase domain-containing protein [Deinococcus sp.]